MPEEIKMNAENLPSNPGRRKFLGRATEALAAAGFLLATGKFLGELEKKEKEEGIKISPATATPTTETSTPEVKSPTIDLNVSEVASMRNKALTLGEEKIPLPRDFKFVNTPVADGTTSISCVEEKRLGWIDFPALAEGDIVNLITPNEVKHIKALGIKTKEGTIFAFLVPQTAEILATGYITMGEPLLKVNHNPYSDFQKNYEEEGGFMPDTVVNIRRLKLDKDESKAHPQNLNLGENVLNQNGNPITIASITPLPMPRPQQA